jgi:hypothetical protein
MWVYRDIDPLPSDGGTTPPPTEAAEVPTEGEDVPWPEGDHA